jgi:hypothetical protein
MVSSISVTNVWMRDASDLGISLSDFKSRN